MARRRGLTPEERAILTAAEADMARIYAGYGPMLREMNRRIAAAQQRLVARMEALPPAARSE